MDPDKQLQKDVRKFRRIRRREKSWTIPKMIETAMWGFAMLTVVVMVGIMPWVGPDGILPGALWLAYLIFGMLFFGGIAMLMRFLESKRAKQMDRKLDRDMRGR